jgi:hypothetical protein
MPKAGAAKSESLYGVHPSVAMVQKSLAQAEGEHRAFAGRVDCAGEERRTQG